MGIFNQLKGIFESSNNGQAKSGNGTKPEGSKGNRTETFTFATLPQNASQLQALPEATLDSPFKTTALTLVALCRYEENPDDAIEMLNFLKGPADVSTYEKQFFKERLDGKSYKIRSYFAGATPQNNYTPSSPYTISVSDNPYSYPDDNWATMYVTSGGADNPRSIKLRKKLSTGQWFLVEVQCLSDIRVPVADDPWA